MSTPVSDQRQAWLAHLARANEIRVLRSALRRRIADGRVTVPAVLAAVPPEAMSWPVSELVRAQHGYGQARADQLLDRLRIPTRRPVGCLTERQRRVLAQALTAPPEPLARCRKCGCLDAAACTRPGALTRRVVCCHWVAEDLCSACLEESLAVAAGGDPTGSQWTHPSRAYTDAVAALRGA